MKVSQIFIASDHAGFPLKEKVINFLKNKAFNVEDIGPSTEDRVDYPDYASKVCELIDDESKRGVLICGSGQGMAMRANKYSHIRAALCWDSSSAQLSRQHNNANVLCMGARLLTEDTILQITEDFFTVEFEGGRHQNRVEKISNPT
ncbi:MAG: ribose 5-phosphate isomerase B [Bdellovibrionales bacterium]|nr:ribose 5-phosphate isomerase B [Bdellovibrionales bacterium]